MIGREKLVKRASVTFNKNEWMRRELVCFVSFRVKRRQKTSVDDETVEIRCSITIPSVSACTERVTMPAEIVIFHLFTERERVSRVKSQFDRVSLLAGTCV